MKARSVNRIRYIAVSVFDLAMMLDFFRSVNRGLMASAILLVKRDIISVSSVADLVVFYMGPTFTIKSIIYVIRSKR